MQRTDRTLFIIATVLVVVFAAGGIFALVVRFQTPEKAQPPASEPVALVPIEDTSTAAVSSVPTTPPAPKVPKQPKGSDVGYLTKLSTSGGLSLRYDPVELEVGAAADLYAKQQGKVMADKLYYIANATHKTKAYDVSGSAVIVLTASDGTTSTVAPSAFKAQFDKDARLRKALWWVFVRNDSVVRLEQVVLPPAALPQ